MAAATTTHRYRGQLIIPCERAAGEHHGRWVLVTYHRPTGMPWSDEQCPHYRTLEDATNAVDYAIDADERAS